MSDQPENYGHALDIIAQLRRDRDRYLDDCTHLAADKCKLTGRVAELERDRDELLAALEALHDRDQGEPGSGCDQPGCSCELCRARALIRRIKGTP